MLDKPSKQVDDYPSMASTRRLTAILAADVAGYSRLMGADEEGTFAALKALRRELSDPKIKVHSGRIRHCQLNGVEVSFPAPLVREGGSPTGVPEVSPPRTTARPTAEAYHPHLN